MANIVMTYVVMAFIVMDNIVMTYVVMAFVVMAASYTSPGMPWLPSSLHGRDTPQPRRINANMDWGQVYIKHIVDTVELSDWGRVYVLCLHSYGLCSSGLYSHGLYNCGQYTYALYSLVL